MLILTFIVVVFGVSVFATKKALDKELDRAKQIYTDEYNLYELIIDKMENKLLGYSGAIYYTE